MQGRVKKTVRHPVMKLYVDFNDVGYDRRGEWVEITDDVLDISGSKEKSGKQIGSISSDIATIVLDNSDNKFSKDNAKSPFYKKVKSNLKFRLLTGFKGEELVPYASGYVEKFSPHRKESQIRMSLTDYFLLFKNEEVPKDSYQDISWDGLINILCDHVKLPAFIKRHIPKTEFYYSYFKFEEENCFEALKSLIEIAAGEVFFEHEEFYVNTKLALDYRLDDAIDHEITVDDLFDFEEDVDGDHIINSVELTSDYKTIAPLQVVFETPENIIKVENESIIYKSGNFITVNQDNLPLINNEENPIVVKNITQGRTIYLNGVDVMTGKITIHPNSLTHVAPNDQLSVSYSYQQLALLAGKQRKFTFSLSEEVDSLNNLDISVWDQDGERQREYSEESDKPNTVSKQMLSFDQKSNTVTLILKNNYPDPTTISTLQFRGYPIKVISPIEVYVRDVPSIESFGKKTISMKNNYINNRALAEKIAQYIVDNNKKDRKRASIEIEGYPEFSLDDISRVIEEKSGTSHKFTNERIDYSFSESGGWTVKATIIEIDTIPWVYESFKGESWEKTHSGEPDPDFLKDINANLVKNGGAELYTGFSDYQDAAAVGGKHIVPDYWRFIRTSGNAASRIRDGGNLVLHGLHSFEITTSNGGTGYYEQDIDYIKPNAMHILSFVCSLTSCSGKAHVLQYEGETLLKTDTFDISGDGMKELTVDSLARVTRGVIRIEKLSGGGTSESFVLDKVKFENSKERTIYLESEETSPIQAGQRYANSVLIGNNYGIEVSDQIGNPRVILGQYEPNKYGMKVYSGALEIIGGLPEDQLNEGTKGKVNNSLQSGANYNGVKITSSGLTAESAQSKVSMDSAKGFEIVRKSDGKKMFAVEPATGNVVFAGDVSGASGNFTGSVSSTKNATTYTILSGGELESRGTYRRTWLGRTTTHDTRMRFQSGYLRLRNETLNRSLYLSDFGISTFIDGEGELGGSSGSVVWWDTTYSDADANGITINSYGGVAALSSDLNRVVLDAYQSANIESRQASVFIRPNKAARPGLNAFSFNVMDGASSLETDGRLQYGSDVNGYGVGLRFSKRSANPTVWVIDGNGERGGAATFNAGIMEANTYYNRDRSRMAYMNGSGTGTTDGGTYSNTLFATAMRTNDSNIYLATDNGGSVHITDHAGYNNGRPINYRPIFSSQFNNASSATYKQNITPYTERGIDIVMDHTVYTYFLDSDLEEGIYDNQQIGFIAEASPMLRYGKSVSQGKAIAINWKATQELVDEIDDLKREVRDLKLMMAI